MTHEEEAVNLCKSCDTRGCIFQSGMKRERCDFYSPESKMINGFTEMMKAFWNNQDLKVPDLETLCEKAESDE